MSQNISAQPIEDFSQYPWFYSGVPREVILDYLSQQEMGSFVIRESTSELGCYALSLKVPNYAAGPGEPRFKLKHYLIDKSPSGKYRLQKGPDKEWATLASLVTHLTVLKEVLPLELRLPKIDRNLHNQPTVQPEIRTSRRINSSGQFEVHRQMNNTGISRGFSKLTLANRY